MAACWLKIHCTKFASPKTHGKDSVQINRLEDQFTDDFSPTHKFFSSHKNGRA